MSFDASPLSRIPAVSGVDPAGTARQDVGTTPPIPTDVWDQVDAASRLAERLHADGRAVRFDIHRLDSGVVASLVDDNGGLLRPLLLEDVVDVQRLIRELGKHYG